MVDTKGLTNDLKGKELRLFFQGGEICEAILLLVDVHENCQFGDDYADFVYEIISTNQPEKYKDDQVRIPKPVYSTEFSYLDRWEIIPAAERNQ
jgi:hypothetical protein